VKRAGRLVRQARRGDGVPDFDKLIEAIDIIEAHRATFKTPLVTANNGLRSMVRTLGLNGQVSQRLKRMSTILDKLDREPTLALDRMQDIGGCRVVLPDRDDVYRLRDRLVNRRPPLRVSDYIAEPRMSGYRGVHVVVEYGTTCPRSIEVQLRTVAMHQWATAVEEISGNSQVNYKMDGATPMQRFLECYSRLLECVDLGINPSPELVDEYGKLLNEAF
jgi:ppGpp synthetase/RelA/SpoT-type nucleotidyltranferase